jgi:hypothetical protein
MILASASWLSPIGRSLREGFFMFWETLWPLVIGFALSGAVQAFASRDAMRRRLGNHRPPAVARATAYGMASSSCSYAASAMAKSLFARGADFVAATVFMVASTNLVVELGVVLLVLMGWQFAVSEFVGGAVMIVLLAAFGGLWLRGRAVAIARQRLAGDGPTANGLDEATAAGPQPSSLPPLARRLRSPQGWSEAARYTVADLGMVRRELFIGYVVAGFATVLIPVSAWHAVLLHGHGFWSSLENVVVGPLVALLSCVCSVGNVPLAAALWHGGSSFGGVVSFVFADLIALPLLFIYRRYYGTRLALRLLAVLWAAMSVAGLVTEGIFRAAGWVPAVHAGPIVSPHFAWNATTFLNVVALAVLVAVVALARRRAPDVAVGGRAGASAARTARDPMCGMLVEVAQAPASLVRDGTLHVFCSDHCRDRFAATSPGASASVPAPVHTPH